MTNTNTVINVGGFKSTALYSAQVAAREINKFSSKVTIKGDSKHIKMGFPVENTDSLVTAAGFVLGYSPYIGKVYTGKEQTKEELDQDIARGEYPGFRIKDNEITVTLSSPLPAELVQQFTEQVFIPGIIRGLLTGAKAKIQTRYESNKVKAIQFFSMGAMGKTDPIVAYLTGKLIKVTPAEPKAKEEATPAELKAKDKSGKKTKKVKKAE